jgi:hypothetical protein
MFSMQFEIHEFLYFLLPSSLLHNFSLNGTMNSEIIISRRKMSFDGKSFVHVLSSRRHDFSLQHNNIQVFTRLLDYDFSVKLFIQLLLVFSSSTGTGHQDNIYPSRQNALIVDEM